MSVIIRPSVADSVVIKVKDTTRATIVTALQTGPQGASGAAGGMQASVYDPTGIVGDAFDMDNMVEGTTGKILTPAERAILVNTALTTGLNTGDQDLSGKEDTGVAAGLMNTHTTTHPAPTVRDARNAPALTSDDNYVTDAEKVVIGNTSGTNTGDQVIPTALSDLSQDALNRVTTDTEKAYWNAKQEALVADTDYLTPTTASTTYAPALGTDDNYVTDAEKVVIGNTSGTNTGDQTLPVAGDFNHDDLANLLGTVGEYNHPRSAQMAVLSNTSGTNTGDITLTTTGLGPATLVGQALNIPLRVADEITEGDVISLIIALG